MIQTDSPMEICDEMLGVAMAAAGLAVAWTTLCSLTMVAQKDFTLLTRKALDGIAKSLCRSTDLLADQIETLDGATDWAKAIMDRPDLVQNG